MFLSYKNNAGLYKLQVYIIFKCNKTFEESYIVQVLDHATFDRFRYMSTCFFVIRHLLCFSLYINDT